LSLPSNTSPHGSAGSTREPAHRSEAKRLELLRALLARKGQGAARIAPRAGPGPAPLSFAQERLWFFERLRPGSPVFHIPALYHWHGALDPERLRAALAAVGARHEVLRARFEVGPEGRAVLAVASEPAVPLVDLGSFASRDAFLARAQAFVREPFDLGRGPLARLGHAALGPAEHALVLAIHHAIAEVQSLGVFAGDLCRAYRGQSLEPLAIQFADFAAWQRERAAGPAAAAELAWWRERLAGLVPLELWADHPRPAVQSFEGSSASRALSAELSRAVREFARAEGATLFAVALAAFAAVLGRRGGALDQADIAIGAPMTDRDRPELEPLIGFFVNTLVLRCNLGGQPSMRQLVARCQALALDAREHRDLPFERLVEALAPERNLSKSPLFQVALLLQNESEQGDARLELGGGAWLAPDGDALALHTETSKFDLSLIVQSRRDGGLTLAFEYATALWERAAIERLLGHLETFLAGAVAEPDRPVSSIGLLTEAERRELLDWNATAVPLPEGTVHELFAQAAAQHPRALAVAEGARSLTYAELDQRSDALAERLRQCGVGRGELVGMATERHLELVVGILAVLKAGAAYVPLDLAYPAERLAYMLADARARVVLTRPELQGRIPRHEGRTLAFDVAELTEGAPRVRSSGPVRKAGARDLAYVIYTSGSTGWPKGVELEHRGLVNLLSWHRRAYAVGPRDRATHLAGLAFDASVWEVWPYLTAGASLHLVPDDVRLAPRRLLEWMAEQRITQSFVPTPLAEALLKERLPAALTLEWLLTGGDKLHAPPPAGTPFRLVNHYGPTENTVVATSAEIAPEDPGDDRSAAAAPTIGRPIDNVRLHVVDAGLQPVAVGVAGELLIGGASLARGYHGRAELSAERFVPDALTPGSAGERLYRTGDLVRYGPTGELEFLGRLDGQVKVRGVRVELGEIEAVLARHPDVAEGAVRYLPGGAGGGQLAAYVVARAAVAPSDLRAHLAAALPDAMVPAAVVFLEALPLTPNGKVDRRALPDPGPEAFAADVPYAEPEGQLEEGIAAVWCALLGRERVGANTNFFELGGHSLLLAQAQVRLAESLAPGISVLELFQYPTVRSLARHLAAGRGDNDSELLASRERAEARRARLRSRRATSEPS
jgi:amino acid adenylation domain-containing protein